LAAGLLVLVLDLEVFDWSYRAFDENNKPFDLNRNAAMYSLLIWSAVAMTGFQTGLRTVVAVFMLSLTVLALFASQGEAAQVSLLAGLGVSVLLSVWRLFYRSVFWALAAGIMIFPLLVPHIPKILDHFPRQADHYTRMVSAVHRIEIWKGYASLVAERPLTGWGMHAHRYLGKQGEAGAYAEKAGYPRNISHPHNFILEIWVNLGGVGALLAAGVVVLIGRVGEVLPTLDRTALAATVTSWYVVSLTGHSFTQSWWVASTAIVGIVLAQSRSQRQADFASHAAASTSV
jgi:O-antigen ligase